VTEVFHNLTEVFLTLTEVYLTLTEIFPCSFLSCKENARVKLRKAGHGPHSSTLVCICVVWLLFMLFYVLFVYCHRVTNQLELKNINHITSKKKKKKMNCFISWFCKMLRFSENSIVYVIFSVYILPVATEDTSRSWFRASSLINFNKNQPDAHQF
jgi:hypothetical protein